MIGRLLAILAPPLCTACDGYAGRAGPLCAACRAELERSALGCSGPTWSAFSYDGPAGAIVRALKFGGRTALADLMAAQIAARVPPDMLTGALVPVPLHPARLRRRGFDQAALIAAALARRVGVPVLPCLQRAGDATPQMGRPRASRLSALAGDAIRVRGAPPPR